MTLEEQMQLNQQLWEDGEKFHKEHRYNLRHMYGQEGKRANYTPYNCQKIISSLPVPGVQDHHGCPFKHFDEENLKKLMLDFGVKGRGLNAVLEMAKTHQPQMACVEYFKCSHRKASADGVGNHPNAFYKESQRFLNLWKDDVGNNQQGDEETVVP